MVDAFFLTALGAGALFCLISGPLGSLMLWKRLSFFGDALAHASLSGVALALLYNVAPLWAVAGVCLLIGLFLSFTPQFSTLSKDTWLAILSHGSLGIGLFIFSLVPGSQHLLSQVLFGDILTTAPSDLIPLAVISLISLGGLTFYWKQLLAITIHEDLARVEGLPVQRLKTFFMILLSLTIAVAAQFLGILLLTALLIFPATAARLVTKTPTHMAITASLIGFLGLVLGLFISGTFDSPATASIVLAHLGLLILFSLVVFLRAKILSKH
jgi:zinc transport system permease protein